MAATINNVAESKESTSAQNVDMETARAKGTVAIAIAKLQPTVRLLITYVEIWAYYTLIPFKVGQLTMDVVVLGLEITKLCLISVKANTNLFVQLFKQILAILSPDFILNLLQSFSTILTSLVEKIMHDLLNVVQKFIDGLTQIFKQPIVVPGMTELPGAHLAEALSGKHEVPRSGDSGREILEPTNEAAAPHQPPVNGESPKKSDKTGKSEHSE